jgi:branched-chain amino acid transport system permease protein
MDKLKRILSQVALRIKHTPQLQFIVLGVVLMVIGRLVISGSSPTNINFFAEVVIYAVVALGLNLLLGFSGLVSLSTAAFIGVTTNSMSVFIKEFDYPFLLAALLSLIIAGILGLFIGVLSLKMEGIYLAIATLFVGHIIIELFKAFERFNYGETTRVGSTVKLIFNLEYSNFFPEDRIKLFNLIVIGLVLTFIIIYNIFKSPTGRALMAISRSQHAALAMGISVRKYRLLAFMIATMTASFGGILHVLYFQTTGTADKWGLGLSLTILAIVVVGGIKSFYGILLGSFILIGIPSIYLRDIAFLSGFEDIITGLLIVIVILFYPYGAAKIGYDLKKLYYKLKLRIKQKAVKHDE